MEGLILQNCPLDRLSIRSYINKVEIVISKLPGVVFGDSDACPLTHEFTEGIYTRKILIPAGTFIVGKIHKHSHPNFLMKGEVSVLTESEGIQRIKAPFYTISPAGTKRIVYAHSDCEWITIHATMNTDLEKIEEEIIVKTYDELVLSQEERNILEEIQ